MNRLLEASNISFSFGPVQALRDVSIRLFPNEVVALIGPNGSGKSTLIRVLIGALRPKAGGIKWDEKPIGKWSRRRLAQHVAYLAQSPLYDPTQTVLDVLRLGRAPYWHLFGLESTRDAQVVEEVARRLGLIDLLTRPMDQISGGQRQMVFLGRALVQEPKAILLDEPNTFLDLKHQVELMALLRSLAKDHNVGVLMASHDLNLAAAGADTLILLDRGTIAADGTAEQVLNPELIARVYDVPMERITREGRPPILLPEMKRQA